MCMTAIEPLTLAGLLADPLTRMVMHSDGVSEHDFVELWLRIQRIGLRAISEASPLDLQTGTESLAPA